MPKIEGGFLLLSRRTLESPIFTDKPAEWFKIWIYILMRTHWGDDKRLPRGSVHLKYQWIAEAAHVSIDSIDKFLRWARDRGMLATRRTVRGTIITVVKFAEYQDPSNYRDGTPDGTRTERGRNADGTILNKVTKEQRNKETNAHLAMGGSGFDSFWEAYPRKVAKKRASKIWKALAPSEELVSKIVDHVKAMACGDQWKKDGGQYIPHPSTYLSQERWTCDVPLSPAEKPKKPYIDGERAYQDERGDWKIIPRHGGEHLTYVGPLDAIKYV